MFGLHPPVGAASVRLSCYEGRPRQLGIGFHAVLRIDARIKTCWIRPGPAKIPETTDYTQHNPKTLNTGDAN